MRAKTVKFFQEGNQKMVSSEEEGEIEQHQILKINKNAWCYDIKRKIGEGTFGKVFLCSSNNKSYALKSIIEHNTQNGLPLTTVREVKILKSIKHPNIIEIIEIAARNFDINNFNRKKCELFLVFPYLKGDLSTLIQKKPLSNDEVRFILGEIINGLAHLKSKNIMHRDLKTSNILIGEDYAVKIADFGLAKGYVGGGYNTPGVVTLWYRPPEILLRSYSYDHSADIWSLGCILGEMLIQKPVFRGKDEISQLKAIINGCGTIDIERMKHAECLEYYKEHKLPESSRKLEKMFEGYGNRALDMINLMLVLYPDDRADIEKLQRHSYVKKRLSKEALREKRAKRAF